MGDTNVEATYKDEGALKEYGWRKIKRFTTLILNDNKHDRLFTLCLYRFLQFCFYDSLSRNGMYFPTL